jgi:osmotically-inducible protein OsmY
VKRGVFIVSAVLIGVLAGWSAAYINATTAPLDRDALNEILAREIKARLAETPLLRNFPLEVVVDSDRKLVTVSGFVNSESRHRQVLELLTTAQSGYNVRDNISVSLPPGEFTAMQAQRHRDAARANGELVGSAVSDAWIHAEISARLRANPATASQSALQVDVIDGEVTLRGLVSLPEQKIAAEHVAADIEGVALIKNQLKTVIDPGRSYRSSVG